MPLYKQSCEKFNNGAVSKLVLKPRNPPFLRVKSMVGLRKKKLKPQFFPEKKGQKKGKKENKQQAII